MVLGRRYLVLILLWAMHRDKVFTWYPSFRTKSLEGALLSILDTEKSSLSKAMVCVSWGRPKELHLIKSLALWGSNSLRLDRFTSRLALG